MTNYAFTSIELPINKNLLTPFSFGSNPLHPMDYDYHWVFIVACIAAFITAYALGANDVANSFAPSVGAKTLRLWQACLVAAFCEFFGAYLLGARSTDTIKSKIVSLSAFYGSDDILMFGMLCSDFGAGIWMLTATRFELHVSSTHSIIGAIIGMSLAARGAYAVNWPSVGLIIASWFISPILSGIISAGLFVLVRRFILRSENSFDRALKFYPIILAITLSLQISFILIKAGIANGRIKNLSQNDAIGVACAAGFGFAILFYFTVLSQVRKRYQGYPEEDPEETERKLRQAAKQAELNDKEAQNGKDSEEKSSEEKPAEETTALAYADADAQQQPTSADATNGKSEQDKVEPEKSEHPTGVNRGISFKPTEKTNAQLKIDKVLGGGKLLHSVVETNKKVENIHDSAEVFPYRTECVFAVLQVFTACCASFSHGANDVANAVGPLATVSAIYDTGSVAKASKVSVPDWILLLGAAGIVIGLSTYGWKILGAMGVKMVKLTPSRGFAIELGASIVILVGSSLGIPLSTTHCTTGSTVAIGLAEGKLGSVNWKLFGKMAAAWMVTLIMAGANAALLFSFATWAPSQYYPASQSNCLYLYGQVFNATTTGYSGNVQVPQYQGSVSVLAGYPANGAFVNIMQYNPPKP